VVLTGSGATLMQKEQEEDLLLSSTFSRKWTEAQAPFPASFPILHVGLRGFSPPIINPTGGAMMCGESVFCIAVFDVDVTYSILID